MEAEDDPLETHQTNSSMEAHTSTQGSYYLGKDRGVFRMTSISSSVPSWMTLEWQRRNMSVKKPPVQFTYLSVKSRAWSTNVSQYHHILIVSIEQKLYAFVFFCSYTRLYFYLIRFFHHSPLTSLDRRGLLFQNKASDVAKCLNLINNSITAQPCTVFRTYYWAAHGLNFRYYYGAGHKHVAWSFQVKKIERYLLSIIYINSWNLW